MTSLSQKLSKQKGSDLGFWFFFFFVKATLEHQEGRKKNMVIKNIDKYTFLLLGFLNYVTIEIRIITLSLNVVLNVRKGNI